MTTTFYPSKDNPTSFRFRYYDKKTCKQVWLSRIDIPAEYQGSKKKIDAFVKEKEVEYQKQLNAGYPGRLTVKQVYEKYIESERHNLEKSTVIGYDEKFNPHIAPRFGDKMIDQITKEDLDAFINSLQENGANKKNGKPLSKKSVKDIRFILVSIFRYAKNINAIVENPAEKMTKVRKVKTKPADRYTEKELRKIVSSLKDMKLNYKLAMTLLIQYGARRETVVGLTWDEIDFEKMTITFKTCVLHDKVNGTYVKEESKNGKAVTLPITVRVYDALMEYKHNFKSEELDKISNPRGFLFYNYVLNQPMNPESIDSYLKRFEKRQKEKDPDYPHIVIKKFRTTVPSHLMDSGYDAQSVADYIGDDVNTMLKYYAKKVSTKEIEMANKLGNVFSGMK